MCKNLKKIIIKVKLQMSLDNKFKIFFSLLYIYSRIIFFLIHLTRIKIKQYTEENFILKQQNDEEEEDI